MIPVDRQFRQLHVHTVSYGALNVLTHMRVLHLPLTVINTFIVNDHYNSINLRNKITHFSK